MYMYIHTYVHVHTYMYIQLASAAMSKMNKVWIRGRRIHIKKRLKMYNTLVKPILTCTWGLTKHEREPMNTFHHHQLRLVWKFNWKMKVRNTKLYEICNCGPISEKIKRSKWRMLGHALTMNKETPTWKAMKYYFESIYEEGKFRGRPRTTLVSIINEDIKTAQQKAPIISTLDPLQKLQDMRKLAEDRRTWKNRVSSGV